MKICLDCKYHRGEMDRVNLDEIGCVFVDLMVAGAIEDASTCAAMRRDRNYCGPDAKWFEPKE